MVSVAQARARIAEANAALCALETVAEPPLVPTGPGPLDGWPLAVKSNIAVGGLPWTAGVGARRHIVAAADAPAVAVLRRAGAVVVGTAAMHEAALGATTDNAFYGRAFNPVDGRSSPGGSSGGSAAAVAAGMARIALGTDSSGSIRIPASFCGVYGWKPGRGVVDAAGSVPLAPEWDAIGPLANSMADLRTVAGVLAPGLHPGAPANRIGTLSSVDAAAMHPAVAAAFSRAKAALAAMGSAVVPCPTRFDPNVAAMLMFAAMARHAAVTHADLLAADPQGFSGPFKVYLQFGTGFSAASLAEGGQQLAAARAEVLDALGTVDALLLPTTPDPAHLQDGRPDARAGDFTCLANLAGCGAVTIPAGRSDLGLPVGVQLVCRPGEDGRVLALAAALDAALRALPAAAAAATG